MTDNNLIKLLIVSNIIHEPYFQKSIKQIRSNLEISYSEFEGNEKCEYSDYEYIIIWINYEKMINSMLGDADSYQDLLNRAVEYFELYTRKIRENNFRNIVIVGMEDYYNKTYYVQGNIADDNRIIEAAEYALQRLFENFKLIDLKKAIARIGINNAYDEVNKCRWNSPYSERLYEEISKDIVRIIDSNLKFKYKCIAVDCDNVLWGGILSEQKIVLGELGSGRKYKDFQRFLSFLFRKGYLLALLSKNDADDVRSVFQVDREMVIKENQIAYFGVSWESKSINMRRMVEFLHISPDSIVFIDDSKIEIEEMRANCPEVKSILFNPETIYQELSFLNVSEKDQLIQNKMRTATFSADINRQKVKSSFKLNEDYLKEIKNNIEIDLAKDFELERISELSWRVNRVTNGMRYGLNDLIRIKQTGEIYSINASDKFGDLGLVGAMIICDGILMLFCLSCRALGRNIESQMISYLKNKPKVKSCFFKNTNKNSAIIDLLKKIDDDFEVCIKEG